MLLVLGWKLAQMSKNNSLSQNSFFFSFFGPHDMSEKIKCGLE